MCILFIAVQSHENYPLIIAANRDEFHARPTQTTHWWDKQPSILAGRDLQAGGTWMGADKQGYFGALTNIRAPSRMQDDKRTRGELIVNYLNSTEDTRPFISALHEHRDDYNGYNLLFGKYNDLRVYNNYNDEMISLTRGVYGLSNAALNSPWPKTTKGMQALSAYCETLEHLDEEALFAILRDDVKAHDEILPSTGVPYEWEKLLSSSFIQSPQYGTRNSTLYYVDRDGLATWSERVFDSDAKQVAELKYTIPLND